MNKLTADASCRTSGAWSFDELSVMPISGFWFQVQPEQSCNRGDWQLLSMQVGWPTGLEPATAGTTIRGSTIELRPPQISEPLF
jgi:hypothetical protein